MLESFFFDRVKFVLVFVMFGVWFLLVLALSFRCVVCLYLFLSMLLFINTKKMGDRENFVWQIST